MAHYKMLDGNGAAVEAIRMAKVKVVSAYPITPQSTIAENCRNCATAGNWMQNTYGWNRSIRP